MKREREKERKKKERRTGKSPNMKGADVVRQFKGSRYRLTVVAPNLHSAADWPIPGHGCSANPG